MRGRLVQRSLSPCSSGASCTSRLRPRRNRHYRSAQRLPCGSPCHSRRRTHTPECNDRILLWHARHIMPTSFIGSRRRWSRTEARDATRETVAEFAATRTSTGRPTACSILGRLPRSSSCNTRIPTRPMLKSVSRTDDGFTCTARSLESPRSHCALRLTVRRCRKMSVRDPVSASAPRREGSTCTTRAACRHPQAVSSRHCDDCNDEARCLVQRSARVPAAALLSSAAARPSTGARLSLRQTRIFPAVRDGVWSTALDVDRPG
ncbi:hypothetical protein EXIGLDRAFT_293406 [Exidia glandulosa HHB12029]|uniref:Uncharacterized protein n=1 Tax=Exidia glandulosa HHB12029 TaxID=1314781 RepID=A0A165M2L2_EXIGL|nr:hypothetical protein EXIGLDRAFT_293406 [Exidia glandulosa HHB12029]